MLGEHRYTSDLLQFSSFHHVVGLSKQHSFDGWGNFNYHCKQPLLLMQTDNLPLKTNHLEKNWTQKPSKGSHNSGKILMKTTMKRGNVWTRKKCSFKQFEEMKAISCRVPKRHRRPGNQRPWRKYLWQMSVKRIIIIIIRWYFITATFSYKAPLLVGYWILDVINTREWIWLNVPLLLLYDCLLRAANHQGALERLWLDLTDPHA